MVILTGAVAIPLESDVVPTDADDDTRDETRHQQNHEHNQTHQGHPAHTANSKFKIMFKRF